MSSPRRLIRDTTGGERKGNVVGQIFLPGTPREQSVGLWTCAGPRALGSLARREPRRVTECSPKQRRTRPRSSPLESAQLPVEITGSLRRGPALRRGPVGTFESIPQRVRSDKYAAGQENGYSLQRLCIRLLAKSPIPLLALPVSGTWATPSDPGNRVFSTLAYL